MSDSNPQLAPPDLAVVIVGDDAVAAGMLALDLVQSGVRAQAASDEFAVLDVALAARSAGTLDSVAVVAAFDDVGRITGLWSRLTQEGLATRFVAAVRARDVALAEHESVRSGWLGVLQRPIQQAALVHILRKPPKTAQRREEKGGEDGDLAASGLGALLDQALYQIGRGGPGDVVIRLESDGRRGEVAIVDGELVHAAAEADHGRHALERMFCWHHGSWRVVHGRHVGARTLGGAWRGMIAAAHEYARRVEEARLSVPFQYEVCQVRWERVRPLPPVAEAMFRRVAAGMPLGEALDGEGDDELEAYAALLSRLGRGAVLPRDQNRSASQAMARTSGVQSGVYRAQGRGSRPTMLGGGMNSGWSRPTPMDNPGGAVPLVDAPNFAGAGHRHSATSAYRSDGVTPVDVGPAHQSGGVLPSRLPSHVMPRASDAHEPMPEDLPAGSESERSHRATVGAYRSAGWFGVPVHQEAQEGQARLEALGQRLVAGTVEPVAPAGPPITTSTAPSGAQIRSFDVAALDAWSESTPADPRALDDEAEAPYEIPVEEPTQARPRTLLWLLAGGLACAIAVLVLFPGSPLVQAMAGDEDSPVVQTHRRAVEMVDRGDFEQAMPMLRLIIGRPGVSPEATLELAILEIERGDREFGRRLLRQYTIEPGASHADKARQLYDRLFAGELAPR
ncbi:MAG: DUF4388 domain-containing protein [Deltaproteobacteria bacterium]|nr:DUF4388 domain-containing protein [Deltaproteobacteria bacterium]